MVSHVTGAGSQFHPATHRPAEHATLSWYPMPTQVLMRQFCIPHESMGSSLARPTQWQQSSCIMQSRASEHSACATPPDPFDALDEALPPLLPDALLDVLPDAPLLPDAFDEDEPEPEEPLAL